MTDLVIFDVFGTLLHISEGSHPYRQIISEGIRQGRRPRSDDSRTLMTKSLGLRQAADFFGIDIDPVRMADLQWALDIELAGIEAFKDALEAVALLQQAGVMVAVCSNLAAPYAEPVSRLFPGLSAYGFSFEIGSIKPEPSIYRATCELAIPADKGLDKRKVVMIGDSLRCDRDGARDAGIQGFLLDRSGGGDYDSLVEFANAVLQDRLT